MLSIVATTAADVFGKSYNTSTLLWSSLNSHFSDMTLWVWGTLVAHMIVFWGLNAFLLYADLYQTPKWILKYKIQDGKNAPLDWGKFKSAVTRALFNQLAMMPVFSYFSFGLAQWRGIEFGTPLPSLQTVLLSLAFYAVVEEVMFYYSHLLLHKGALYVRIHKLHHEWQAPIGITSIYAHPVEHFLSNLLPIATGPLLLGSHLLTIWIWYSVAIISTIISHSGYHLPFLPSPEFHDYHHLKFNNNFGVFGFLDWIHGTDKNFRSSVQFKHHFASFSTKSVKEICGDAGAKKATATADKAD